MANRNPTWTRDELILALDLYFELDFARNQSDKDTRISLLSSLLKTLPIHDKESRGADFRNTTGVYMKLCNFLRFDSNYQGKGLGRGSKGDELVWSEFANDPEKLRCTATLIKNSSVMFANYNPDFQAADEEFAEGRILTRIHKTRERNSNLTRKKKESVLRLTGKLMCEVCGFDFYEFYREIGKGFAECHHTVPLSSLILESKTKLSDLAILCANCHRMMHRSRKWLSVEDLKSILLPCS